MSDRDFLLFAGVFDSTTDARQYFLTDWSLDEPQNRFSDELGILIDEDFCELHEAKLTVIAEIKLTYPTIDTNRLNLDRFSHYFLVGRYALDSYDKTKEILKSSVSLSNCQLVLSA